ncbi:glycosyltransferase family 2 protein [Dongia soli]|uniref:Glycosyltransferase n=1 Tax=Dongia soli TaxID=600628 RepID=A0ABU5E605_9PROT|nr:glycosyltransferase [Dongia soli]MDY0881712.1 glycosyltransferase [Dongia soli]
MMREARREQRQPDVSVIIAAYQAREFIETAIASVVAQQHQDFEIVVAPDEPDDYAFLAQCDPRIRLIAPVAAPTGPAKARNRATAAARGRFIAVLDADDCWSPNYLSRLLPLAERHGTAYGRTAITDWQGVELRSIPARDHQATIGFEEFAAAYGSLHGVTRLDPARQWQDLLAEDVLYDLESLALAGGAAPYAADAIYTLRIRQQSLSHSDHFIHRIDAGYEQLIALIRAGATAIAKPHFDAAAGVFHSWRRMNGRFATAWQADRSTEFHAFVAGLAGEPLGE